MMKIVQRLESKKICAKFISGEQTTTTRSDEVDSVRESEGRKAAEVTRGICDDAAMKSRDPMRCTTFRYSSISHV